VLWVATSIVIVSILIERIYLKYITNRIKQIVGI